MAAPNGAAKAAKDAELTIAMRVAKTLKAASAAKDAEIAANIGTVKTSCIEQTEYICSVCLSATFKITSCDSPLRCDNCEGMSNQKIADNEFNRCRRCARMCRTKICDFCATAGRHPDRKRCSQYNCGYYFVPTFIRDDQIKGCYTHDPFFRSGVEQVISQAREALIPLVAEEDKIIDAKCSIGICPNVIQRKAIEKTATCDECALIMTKLAQKDYGHFGGDHFIKIRVRSYGIHEFPLVADFELDNIHPNNEIIDITFGKMEYYNRVLCMVDKYVLPVQSVKIKRSHKADLYKTSHAS